MLRPIRSFSRVELESEVTNLRTNLATKSAAYEFLKFRSEQAMLDTGRCAGLLSSIHTLRGLLRRRHRLEALEVIDALIEEAE